MTLLDRVLSGVYKDKPSDVRDDLRQLANDRLVDEPTRSHWEELILNGQRLNDIHIAERRTNRTNGHKPGDEPTILDPSTELDQLLAEPEDDYDWLVPGLLERGDRTIITGIEGGGKSTLIRQMCIQFALGTHPFGGQTFDPVSSLVVDVENSRRQVRRKVRSLRSIAGDAYNPVGARVSFEFRPDGLNLLDDAAVNWLDLIMGVNLSPEILAIGPIYKLAYGDPTREETALSVASSLDKIRDRHGCAILIEAHSPYADGSKSKRPVRPYGASLWSRWPEFGIYLSPEGKIEHWRGARDERAWPTQLERGTPWPWMPSTAAAEPEAWNGPTACMEAVTAVMVDGQQRSISQLHTALRAIGHGFRKETVAEAAERLALARELGVMNGPRNSRIFSFQGVREVSLDDF